MARKFLGLPIILALLLAIGAISWQDSTLTLASPAGLQNPGFEDGIKGGDPLQWRVNSRPDAVIVTGPEGPADFPTYVDMGNITVSPYKGDLMLRLGAPRRIAENQARGVNAVSQTFVPNAGNLKFTFRLFSWEQRNSDTFRFDLKANGQSVGTLSQPLVIKRADNTVMATCTGVPCEFTMNVGQQGEFLDTGWQVVEIVNVPADGRSVTLSYGAGGTKDQAHPTWAYFDNKNTPPVAKFSFAPADPQEGDVLQFIDLSYDPDPGDSIVARDWNIDGTAFTAESPFYVFPDEGNYDATLTVTDSDGDSTSVTDGATALDGDLVPALVVTNAKPLVNALNIEALSGRPISLTGRFIDAGWEDTHTASWSIGPAATVQEENDPLLSSGIVTGSLTTTSNRSGTLIVSDPDGGSGSDSFNVTVVPDTAESRERFEPNDSDGGATPKIASDGSYISFLQREGDIDLYRIRLPDGSVPPAGSEIMVSATDLPADYDVALLAQAPEGVTTGFSRVGFSRVGFSRVGFSRVDSSILGFSRVGFSRVGFSRVGFSRVGLSTFNTSGVRWADLGFSRVGFSRVGFSRVGSEVTPTDISLDELGLATIGGDNLKVADFSANRGLSDETAWARSAVSGTEFIVAVFAPDGAHSLNPYSLSVEVIQPPDLQSDLGEVCNGSPLVTTGATSTTSVLYGYDDPATPENDAADTVFVLQEQRLRAIYSMDDAAWQALLDDLIALAQHPTVKGDIISAPSTIFDGLDTNPCSIDAANNVTTQIRSILQSPAYAGADNVVLVGSDDIIPFRREPDQTVIGNERDYLLDSFLKAGSPLYASILQGYVLTDDYYVDDAPDPGGLHIPARAIGRLVENPGEIRAVAQAYLASNGVLETSSGFVSGYDFFQDGANAVADAIDAGTGATSDRLINTTWTADELRCGLLGQGADPACQVHDVNSPNAHFAHYAGLSAYGFANDDFTEIVTGSEVAAAGGETPPLINRIVFSMGCHAGFNSPDRSSADPGAGVGFDPAMDFAQAMAHQRAIYVASTGYGLGDDEGIGGTEKLMELFAQELLQGDTNAGRALVQAKQDYITSLSTITVYDVKVSIQATFYGMPTYQAGSAAAASLLPATQTEQLQQSGQTFELTTVDPTSDIPSVTTSHSVAEITTDTGSYYTFDGDAQATIGRPVQPRVASDIDERHPHTGEAPPVKGVLLTGGSYQDIADFDALMTDTTLEWEVGGGEPQECLAGFWPSELGIVNSLESGGALSQTLVTIGGQFRCTSGAASPVTGVERLYSNLSFELQRCASSDGTPPVIDSIELRPGEGSDALLRLEAHDPSGITRIQALRFSGGTITPTTLDVPPLFREPDHFDITIPDLGPDDELVVQVEDGGCNVASATAKGAGLNLVHVDGGPDQLFVPGVPNTFTATVSGFTQLTDPVNFIWDFGDGTFLDGILSPADMATVPVTIDGSGNATFSVQHSYSIDTRLPVTATLRVTDSAGGIGLDDVNVGCDARGDASDPAADLVGCSVGNTSTTMTIAIRADAGISDFYQYRVYLDAGKYNSKTKAYRQPPDGVIDVQLKYNNGSWTGLTSLQVVRQGNELQFTFALSELGLRAGDRVQWSAETQAGVPTEPTTGKADGMPDAGFFSYTLR